MCGAVEMTYWSHVVGHCDEMSAGSFRTRKALNQKEWNFKGYKNVSLVFARTLRPPSR